MSPYRKNAFKPYDEEAHYQRFKTIAELFLSVVIISMFLTMMWVDVPSEEAKPTVHKLYFWIHGRPCHAVDIGERNHDEEALRR